MDHLGAEVELLPPFAVEWLQGLHQHDEPELAPYIGPVYPTSMTRHIFESFGFAAKVTLHVSVLRAARDGGRADAHHVVEAQFKAFSRALREAVEIDPRNAGTLPSTKGVL